MPAEAYADRHCDLSRIHLLPEGATMWPQVHDECNMFDRSVAFSPGADNLVAWGLVTQFDLGPHWKIMRSLCGMQWAMEQKRTKS